jgi:S1-C subfamily serine protease
VTSILAGDKQNDLAVLKAEAKGLRPLPLAGGIRVGEPVYCVSHPMLAAHAGEQGFFMFSSGVVSARYAMSHHGEPPIDVLAVTCDYAIGSSGGPIVDARGAVVGMVCQAYPVTTTTNALVQMVWRLSRPAEGLSRLVSGPGAAVGEVTRAAGR